jgi:hypothetical protein
MNTVHNLMLAGQLNDLGNSWINMFKDWATKGARDGSGAYAPDQKREGNRDSGRVRRGAHRPRHPPTRRSPSVRRLTGLSLWRSKVLVDQAPVVILNGMPGEPAGIAATAPREAGAQAEARQHPSPVLPPQHSDKPPTLRESAGGGA